MAFPFDFERKSKETETTTWSEFSNGAKATVEQIEGSEEIINPQGMWAGKLIIWVTSLEIAKL